MFLFIYLFKHLSEKHVYASTVQLNLLNIQQTAASQEINGGKKHFLKNILLLADFCSITAAQPTFP